MRESIFFARPMQGNPTPTPESIGLITGPTGLDLLASATQAEARVAIGSPAFAGDGTATVTTNSVVRSQVDSSGNVTSTIPGGSVLLPEFKCRAWVNFDGTTSPPTIRASGNVSSLSKVAEGLYTINFITAMPDANYAVAGQAIASGEFPSFSASNQASKTTTSAPFVVTNTRANWGPDTATVDVIIIR